MFADFSLTDSGDLLIIEKPESIQIQKISFNISNFKTQKINFNIYNTPEEVEYLVEKLNERVSAYLKHTIKQN